MAVKGIKGITLEIGGNTEPLVNALKSVNTQSRNLQNELRQVERLLKLDPTNTELLSQKQKLLAESIATTKGKLDTLKEAERQAQQQFAQGKIKEDEYRALQREIVKTEADLKKLESQTGRTNAGLTSFGTAAENVGKKLTSIGKSLTVGVTVPILAAGAGLVKIGEAFDEAVDKIRIGTGATGENLEALNEDFKQVYGNVPTTMDAASSAVADLNTRLGLTGKPLQDLSVQMINLSRLTKEDLNTLIPATTRVFGDWSVATEDQSETLDELFKVSQSTGISVSRLSDNLVKFGGPLRQLGFDFRTSTALLGKFEKEGVNTELVMGSLRIALGKMAKEGITDANLALTTMIERIKNAGSSGETNALALDMFGAKAGPDMAAAIREGRFEIDELLQTLSQSPETINGAAEDTEDFSEKFTELKNRVSLAVEPIAGDLFDSIDKLIPLFESIIGKIASAVDWFSNLDSGTQAAILTLIGLFVALGPVVTTLGTLSEVTSIVTKALGSKTAAMVLAKLETMAHTGATVVQTVATQAGTAAQGLFNAVMAANPIAAVIIALVALGGAIYAVVKHWQSIVEWIEKAWNWLTRWNQTDADSKELTVTERRYVETVQNPGESTPLEQRAIGDSNWRGGPVWVNEKGGEIMDLPKGTKIIPHDVSMEIARAVGAALGNIQSGGITQHITVQSPKELSPSETARQVKNASRLLAMEW